MRVPKYNFLTVSKVFALPDVAKIWLHQARRCSQREFAFTTPVTVHKTLCHSSTACVAALALMETLTSSDRVFI